MRKLTRKGLKKKLWSIMSEIVRKTERGICFTCGEKRHWKEMQAGHYIHKDCLDYDFINIHCQCPRCNKWLSGNLAVYAEKLIKIYGYEKIEDLRRRSEIIWKPTISELEGMIFEYNNILETINKTL